MICHWEEYNLGPTKPLAERFHATINRKHTILINGNLHEKLGRPTAVKLMFDRVNGVIGVVAASETMKDSFPVRAPVSGRHRLIRAVPFCRFFGIQITGTNLFQDPEIDEDGVLRLNLNGTIPLRKSSLKGRRSSLAN